MAEGTPSGVNPHGSAAQLSNGVPGTTTAEEQEAFSGTREPGGASPGGPPLPPSGNESWKAYETVFTNAKAGMDGVDKDHVKKVVFEMSKNSAYFQNEQRKQAASSLKIEEMQRRSASISQEQLSGFTRQADAQLVRMESHRDLSRVWLHVDMDAFFAAVEERDNPSLKGKPMAVGGTGMISTANYAARKFGVRSAMPGFIAKELCPQLIFVRPNYEKYSRAGEETRKIFREYDPDFEAGSLDEAYLDVTAVVEARGLTGPEVAAEIRGAVKAATSLTCSVGVAPNKRLAKVCSDINKPDGQYEIPAQREAVIRFVETLPIRKVSFIGKVQEQVLSQALGIQACGDLLQHRGLIVALFSAKAAEFYLEVGLGLGVTEHRERAGEGGVGRKGISCERTFRAITAPSEMERKVSELSAHLAADMAREELRGRTLTLKLKGSDFKVHTRAHTAVSWMFASDSIEAAALKLLRAEAKDGRLGALRLMGLRMSHLAKRGGSDGAAEPGQPTLTSFISAAPAASSPELPAPPRVEGLADEAMQGSSGGRGHGVETQRQEEGCQGDQARQGEAPYVEADLPTASEAVPAPLPSSSSRGCSSAGTSSSKAPWTCRVCTLADNPHFLLRCAACDCLRSSTSAAASGFLESQRQWTAAAAAPTSRSPNPGKRGLSGQGRTKVQQQQQHKQLKKSKKKKTTSAGSLDSFLVRTGQS